MAYGACAEDVVKWVVTLAVPLRSASTLSFPFSYRFKWFKTYTLFWLPSISHLFLSGEGPFNSEDPTVAAGLCWAQQTARPCHVSGPADEWCNGHHASWCSSPRPSHLWAYSWCETPASASRAGSPQGQRWHGTAGEFFFWPDLVCQTLVHPCALFLHAHLRVRNKHLLLLCSSELAVGLLW